MNVIPTSLNDCLLIKPAVYEDTRGYFFESYNKNELSKYLKMNVDFVQDNQSKSMKGVLRGLHYQLPPFEQAKLVRVISGEVLDVVVDLRKKSSTYGKYEAFNLSAENKYQLYIPKGFAHGFVTLSESAEFFYKCDNFYAPTHERGIKFDDPTLNINWGISPELIHISSKDNKLPNFSKIDNPF